jgi:Uma2 family endonuclease
LTEDDRVELLEGCLVAKMPHNPPHDGTICRVQRRLTKVLPDEWLLRVQSALHLDNSKPELDLLIARGPEETYLARHPRPKDVALVIEVADTTLDMDRDLKAPLYARNRLPVYWLVNLQEGQIEVYDLPRGGKQPGYRRCQIYTKADTLPLILDGRELARLPVRDLLP